MGLLQEIQEAVLKEDSDLAPVLLKLRLLAARLDSQPLADWVKNESEGYPSNAQLPDYRIIPVSYTGTFLGPFNSGIQNAQIPPYLIEKYAGKNWNEHEMRESIAAVDDLLSSSKGKGGALHTNAANLALKLQGKVYPGYACNDIQGRISRAAVAAIRHSVRSRVLELTIELEKAIPEAKLISMDNPDSSLPTASVITASITQNVIYGNVTAVSATGDQAQINISINQGDAEGLVNYLKQAGIDEGDAKKLIEIVAAEEPESRQEPLGTNAKAWLVDNLKKAANGTWKIGVTVATEVIKEAIIKYYGL